MTIFGKITTTLCLALTLISCAEQDPSGPPWISLNLIDAPKPSQANFDLCTALHIASGGAGLYEVIEIRQNQTIDPNHVRVELGRLESWTTLAPETVILRLPTTAQDPARAVKFEDQEQVAILLLPPMSTNKGFAATLPEFVYRYVEEDSRVYGATLDQEGYPVNGLFKRIIDTEGQLDRPHNENRNWQTLLDMPPTPSKKVCPDT